MKTFLPLLVLAVAHLSTAGVCAQAATDASTTIATAATTDLAAEFLKWKTSSAGQEAYAKGFAPVSAKESASIMSAGPTAEELKRFQAAKERVARMQKEQPLAQFSIETPFALMTPAEFTAFVNKGNYQGYRRLMENRILEQGNITAAYTTVESTDVDAAPATRNLEAQAQQGWVVDTDWQTKGCVTRIKDQGLCGSCTMFAVTAALESGYCAKTGKLYELSEQDIISCRLRTGGGNGCDGAANPDNFDWVSRMNDGSICTEASYPYESAGGDAPGCRRYADPNFKCTDPKIGAKLYGGAVYEDHTELEKVVRQQPVAVGVHMSGEFFQDYKGGVLRGNQNVCKAGSENHAVLIVGFGTLDGVPYWKIKNQYGEHWGDHGWFYLERGYQGHPHGTCGIESYGHYPIFPSSSDPAVDKRCDGRYGVQIEGTGIALTSGVRKSMHCCDACRQNPNCQGYNWYQDSRLCLLMGSVTGETLNKAGIVGARITTKSADLALKVGSIADNTDYRGNDIMPVAAATAEDCGDKCTQAPTCNAFTWSKWNNGMCYLKTAQPSEVVSATPSPDGSPFVRSSIVNKCQPFQNSVDFYGADIKNVQGADVWKCCGLCRATNYCAAYTWTADNGGTCYLKTTGYTVKQAPGAWMISATV